MSGTQTPTLKPLSLPLLWSWVSLEFLMTWMGISDHIEYILYWINWLWLQSHWIQCKRASKTGNFLPKVKMFIIWETLNFTWCFVHQTNSNCLNFHGIEWFYDWSRNKQVIQDQSCHSNCETPCRCALLELNIYFVESRIVQLLLVQCSIVWCSTALWSVKVMFNCKMFSWTCSLFNSLHVQMNYCSIVWLFS